MNVLIVEYDEILKKQEKNILEKKNYIVDEAENGYEAVLMTQIKDYDCILLDLDLPKENGLDVARKIRNLNYRTLIIVLTSKSEIYDEPEQLDIIIDACIPKTSNMKEFVEKIEAIRSKSPIHQEKI